MTTEDLAWGFIILGLLILAYLAITTIRFVGSNPDRQDTDEIPISKIRLGLRAEDMGGPAKPFPPHERGDRDA